MSLMRLLPDVFSGTRRGALTRLAWKVLEGGGLVLLGVALALLLLEGGVRLLRLGPPPISPGFFWTVPHPLGWALTPNAHGRWFDDWYEYDVDFRVNSQGLRDDEHTYAKPAETFRILVLGDSFVEAAQVPLESAWHQVLERELNAAGGRPVEVVAAGVGGWGTDQELLWFRTEGVRYQPDLVLLVFFPPNDFMNNSRALEGRNYGRILKPFFDLKDGELVVDNFPFQPPTQETGVPMPPDPPRLLSFLRPWLRGHSALYRFLDPVLREGAPHLMRPLVGVGLYPPGRETKLAEAGPDYIPVAYGIYAVPLTAEWEEAVRLTDALLRALQAESVAIGARLAVILPSAKDQLYPEHWQRTLTEYPAMRGREWDPEQPYRIVAHLLSEAGIPYLDLLSYFRAEAARSSSPLHFRHDGHWTPYGHRLAARRVAEFLRAEGLFPPSPPEAR